MDDMHTMQGAHRMQTPLVMEGRSVSIRIVLMCGYLEA